MANKVGQISNKISKQQKLEEDLAVKKLLEDFNKITPYDPKDWISLPGPSVKVVKADTQEDQIIKKSKILDQVDDFYKDADPEYSIDPIDCELNTTLEDIIKLAT